MAALPTPQQQQEATIAPHELTLELHRKMLQAYYVDERMKIFACQGKCSFHASARGHEKLQIGMTLLLKPRHDWIGAFRRSFNTKPA